MFYQEADITGFIKRPTLQVLSGGRHNKFYQEADITGFIGRPT